MLDDLLQAQAYRLCHWRVASEEINYRRFFDINELAALSMEKPEVFAATHGLILRLLGEGKVHGVRIDHPDGLYDPQQYLHRLQQHYVLGVAQRLLRHGARRQEQGEPDIETFLGMAMAQSRLAQASDTTGAALQRPLYVVVEKILGARETLREDWPVYGTSGYDFLNLVNGLFVDAEKRQALTRFYRDWTQDTRAFADVVYEAKLLILQVVPVQRSAYAGVPARPPGAEEPLVARFYVQQPAARLARGHRLFPGVSLLYHHRRPAPGRPPLCASRRWPRHSAETRPSAASCLSSCATCCCCKYPAVGQ